MPRSPRLSPSLAVLLAVSTLAGCRQDMHNQPKFFPQRGTTLFADGRSVRPQVVGTVARSQTETATYFTTGLINGAEGDGLPFAVTPAVLERGQERYNIYCTPCHSRVGNGKGMAVQRGYYAATSFHSYRLRSAPLGHFFSVITNGYGAMPDYAAQIGPADRWAIAAYIRALQLSQNAQQADVPTGAHIQPIAAIEETTGFSRDFLGPWLGATPSAATPTPTPAPSAAESPAAPTTSTPAASSATASPASAAAGAQKAAPAPAKTAVIASAKEPAAPGGRQEKPAPEKAEKPAAGNVEKGKTLYNNNCSVCHQPTRAGMPPVFPSLVGVVERVGEKRVRTVAKDGIPDAKPPMPPHPNFTDADLNDLVAFLKTKP